LAEEVALAIAYNDISQAVMLVTPTDLEDFIVGFSIGSGIIADASDIYDLQLSGSGSAQYAQVQIPAARSGTSSSSAANWPAPAAAGCAASKRSSRPCRTFRCCPAHRCRPPSGSTACASASALSAAGPVQRRGARGGVHERQGELLLGREDIGRHNALDKLIGA
jgi:FdhD protein